MEASSAQQVVQTLQAFLLNDAEDLYTRLNQARNWFNTTVSGFEIYLEDEWDLYQDGQTWFDYNLRSLNTKDELPPLASDVYLNHRDEKGVWHLGNYQSSHLRLEDWARIQRFLETHRDAFI
jgi:hypothetical protein